MELSMQDLKDLISTTADNTQPASNPYLALYGKRVLCRTRNSGVSIGILRHAHLHNGTITVYLSEALRVWKWSGALSCSSIASLGATCTIDYHPDGEYRVTEPAAEILAVTNQAWKFIDENKETK